MSYLRKMRGLNARAIGRVSVVGIVSASFALLSGAPVYASERSLVLEEVIVTARKKDELIQDVPGAVTAITGQLKEGSVRRLEDIQAFAPNLFINRTPGIASGAAITIRGVA
ncbi:MAG: hypothetical protein O3A73_13400, partial [Proteobacteria bacterium]|nr:hypothetical protein [Pseudomonadota bacterium]